MRGEMLRENRHWESAKLSQHGKFCKICEWCSKGNFEQCYIHNPFLRLMKSYYENEENLSEVSTKLALRDLCLMGMSFFVWHKSLLGGEIHKFRHVAPTQKLSSSSSTFSSS
jgi:hypothetical protein